MPEINTEAKKAIVLARTSMLFNHAFFGNLAMKLQTVEVADEGKGSLFKTAAVDGKNLYYNADFILSLNEDERVFLVAHEVLHCVFGHLVRRHDRDPQLFNMACDYVINAMLIESKMKMPQVGLYDPKYLDWSAEDVYDDLIKNGVEAKPTLDCHAGDPGFPGMDAGSGGDGDDQDGDGNGKPQMGKAGAGKGLSEEEKSELEDYWKQNLAQAAAAVGAGNVPGNLKRLIDDFLEPKMDWREVIQVHIKSCVRNDYSWLKPNKRTFGAGITLPSMDMDDGIEVAVAIDTSGSVSGDMLRDFLSEIKGIMDQFSSYKIHIACFDTQIHNPETFSEEDDLVEYQLGGGGGTDFMAWWDFAKNQPWIEDVDKILFFTDGMPWGQWGIEDLCETIWIVHGSNNEAPFGTTVFYEDHKK